MAVQGVQCTDIVNFINIDNENNHLTFVATGEVLLMEKSYCSTILPKQRRQFCMACLRRTSTPVPCPGCTQVGHVCLHVCICACIMCVYKVYIMCVYCI